MARIEIPDFKDYLEQWISSSSRKITMVIGSADKLDILYSLEDERVISEDNRSKATIARVLSVLAPGPLIMGLDNLKEETRCILSVHIVSIRADQIILHFDVSVCNGSSMHKSKIRTSEMRRISNRLSNVESFSVSESSLSVNIERSCIYRDYNIKNIRQIYFTGRQCVIEY